MSKIEKLREAQLQREAKYSQPTARPKGITEFEVKRDNDPDTSALSWLKPSWMMKLLFSLLVLSNIVLALKLIFVVRDYASEKNYSLQQIIEMGKTVDDNADKINLLVTGLRAQDVKAKNIMSKIEQLEKRAEIQTAATDNLVKAKNTLFNRVTSLESKVDQ